jgi:hypothetical protein
VICCVCWYVRELPRPADTVLNGYAVCEDHIEVLPHGDRWAAIRREAAAMEHEVQTPEGE